MKILATILLGCLPLAATAQITSTLYEWKTVTVEYTEDGVTEIEDDALGGSLRVSDNGRYAVGTCDDYPYASYIVDINALEQGDTTAFAFLKTPITGERVDKLKAFDVSDDGLIVGGYIEDYLWQPGTTRLGANWQPLSIPSQAITTYFSYANAWSDVCIAKRISPDGTVVLGQFSCYDTATYTDGTTSYSYFWEPCLWYVDPTTGEQTGIKEFYGLAYKGQGFIPWDMNDDGSIIVGMAETQRGDQCPALIRNGALEYIRCPELVEEAGNYDNPVWLEVGLESGGAIWTGRACCIDNSNNVYYYYKDGTGTLWGCKWNINTDERTEYADHHVSSGTDGLMLGMETQYYGMAMIFEGDESLADQVAQICAPSSVSDDGRIIAGDGIQVNDYGYYEKYPAMLIFSQSPIDAGIQTATATGNHAHRDGTEIFSATGSLLRRMASGCNLSALPHGIYIIKETTNGQPVTRKIMK